MNILFNDRFRLARKQLIDGIYPRLHNACSNTLNIEHDSRVPITRSGHPNLFEELITFRLSGKGDEDPFDGKEAYMVVGIQEYGWCHDAHETGLWTCGVSAGCGTISKNAEIWVTEAANFAEGFQRAYLLSDYEKTICQLIHLRKEPKELFKLVAP